MNRTWKRLNLHRETLRELASSHLAQVGGGSDVPSGGADWCKPPYSGPCRPSEYFSCTLAACPVEEPVPLTKTLACPV